MSDVTKKGLRELAEKATPGPWWIDSHGHRMSTEDGMVTVFIADDRIGKATRHPETGNLSHWPNDWDASFIATANPKTVIALLDEIEALEAENARLRAVPDGWRDGYRAAMNSAGWGVRELYVKHQHHDRVDGLLNRCKELEQSFIREADAMLAAAPSAPATVQSDDTARLDFMLQNHRAVVVERLPGDIFDIYVNEGAMGDYEYPSVRHRGPWKPGTDEARSVQRKAIDAAIAAARQECGKV